ncbi:hypothetical protein [Campylobacter upsaliensis]|uniref:Uncharacterized protein n=1 Tax=Campylobacter upsaliensis TaxID=28080 RepID=A0A381EHC2_CAMUP|nr:hypothetical protein [Campylobacter upsaliensis]MCR2100193.1 hypothetical protein [Campylobacter upsaliensis]MCR2102861.1 hypothetical protein [Campylobacter upsaliensis]MCR2104757.1 hypothetical protein [Campylobacter upsaliensis]MCR2108001.1 hypothetical protein [Campylobacter upsaliensis]MCR2109332.1 hypothetical protein [Campylobacter upsaliensis]
MIYILAFFLPYVALFVRGLWIQAIFNFILCVIGYFTILLFFVLLLRFGAL